MDALIYPKLAEYIQAQFGGKIPSGSILPRVTRYTIQYVDTLLAGVTSIDFSVTDANNVVLYYIKTFVRDYVTDGSGLSTEVEILTLGFIDEMRKFNQPVVSPTQDDVVVQDDQNAVEFDTETLGKPKPKPKPIKTKDISKSTVDKLVTPVTTVATEPAVSTPTQPQAKTKKNKYWFLGLKSKPKAKFVV